ncbi:MULTISPECIES: mannitol dehydrogenase family protein [Bifidobacterium]|uniref:mannitol dehydrogenase family protein n=1 Tax=Bifidobacterium TaxID=1678 RepID=UPI0018DD4412|nr:MULTISPECIES: mannitol dehydrogenase family protein [Bifidobacterium]MBH9980152.1 mannitol dehydrogenase family protein [Bifidobacterium asteroides]MBI0099378.1 mannitol dehydrogenase family protein [Bifidobacterium sp. W8114]
MLHLSDDIHNESAAWQKAGVTLPTYDIEAMRQATKRSPTWVHFGAGNLFRAVHAPITQKLLDSGATDRGILVAESFDPAIVDQAYTPFDDRYLQVILKADGSMKTSLVASVAGAYPLGEDPKPLHDLRQVFRNPSLQMVTTTITEKGYALVDSQGRPLPWIAPEFEGGPDKAKSAIAVITALLLERYQADALPLALVSTDNFSRNGERFGQAVRQMADEWIGRGLAEKGFGDYLRDKNKITFPLTMIDRITPNPDKEVGRRLKALGIADAEPFRTRGGTAMAPYTNTEETWYWVVEDDFPAGRPPLEKAGVYMADKDTVNAADQMKVTTCLNPLHTALAVFGMLLGYPTMSKTIADPDLKALVTRLGYVEGLPVVEDPGIFSPKEFLRQVIEIRVPNPGLPDTPARICADTSQKIPVRYGITISKYIRAKDLDTADLEAIPLIIAAWLRLLIGSEGNGTDDAGRPVKLSPDPRLEELQSILVDIPLDGSARKETLATTIKSILADTSIFGTDLNATPLADKIETFLTAMCQGNGAVASTLHKAASAW